MRPTGGDEADGRGAVLAAGPAVGPGGRLEEAPSGEQRGISIPISADGADRGSRRGGKGEERGRPELARGEEGATAVAGHVSRRPRRAAAAAARGAKTYCSDTMLGIDNLYSLRAKGHNI
jgi:hypothetical protein